MVACSSPDGGPLPAEAIGACASPRVEQPFSIASQRSTRAGSIRMAQPASVAARAAAPDAAWGTGLCSGDVGGGGGPCPSAGSPAPR